ncbi:MAG: NAD(+) diphosphatase [Prevotellaceae bacterium]|nr:NAD(+) diphosphatase [Prevotellaceae bacterium]
MQNLTVYRTPVSLPHPMPAEMQAWGGDIMCLAFIGREIVLKKDTAALPSYEELSQLSALLHADTAVAEHDCRCVALGVPLQDTEGRPTAEILPEEYTLCPIRKYNLTQSVETATRISRAKALVEWTRATRFCPCCGHPLAEHPTLSALHCPQCGRIHFPRIEPCVIVLVTRGDRMLLARHVQRNQDIYACIAGFMEAGETAEQAVRREIMEETGLMVRNIRYFGSQSWPFPSQLMIAFTAEYESGEIKLQESEIEHAAWFDREHCPAMPQPGSIAYRMIEWFRNGAQDR